MYVKCVNTQLIIKIEKLKGPEGAEQRLSHSLVILVYYQHCMALLCHTVLIVQHMCYLLYESVFHYQCTEAASISTLSKLPLPQVPQKILQHWLIVIMTGHCPRLYFALSVSALSEQSNGLGKQCEKKLLSCFMISTIRISAPQIWRILWQC